jgi:hypothetical protein
MLLCGLGVLCQHLAFLIGREAEFGHVTCFWKAFEQKRQGNKHGERLSGR